MPPSKDEAATLNFILNDLAEVNRQDAPDKDLLARKALNWDRKLAALEGLQKGTHGDTAKAELNALGAQGFAQIGPGIFAPTTDKKLGLIGHELTHIGQSGTHSAAATPETLGSLRLKLAPLAGK